VLCVEVFCVAVLALGNDVHQGDRDKNATGERVRDAKYFRVSAALAKPERKHPTDDSFDEQNGNRSYLEPEDILHYQSML